MRDDIGCDCGVVGLTLHLYVVLYVVLCGYKEPLLILLSVGMRETMVLLLSTMRLPRERAAERIHTCCGAVPMTTCFPGPGGVKVLAAG